MEETKYCVKYDFFDKDFNLLKNDKYYSTCFARLYEMPQKSHYVRYFLEINVNGKQAKEYLEILFDLFPFMKETILETINEIIEKKYVTTSVNNDQAVIFATFTAMRYLRDYKHIVENILKFKEDYSIEEAFVKAHAQDTYKEFMKNGWISGIEMNSGHLLIPCLKINTKKWAKNFRKRFKPKDLKNGPLNGSKYIHCILNNKFYYDIVKEEP